MNNTLKLDIPAALTKLGQWRADTQVSSLYHDFDPDLLRLHKPDLHLVVLDDESTPTARCSLWWNDVPQLPGESIMVLGHYAALNDQSALALLDSAQSVAKTYNRSSLVGPMDGNTWRPYRFVTQSPLRPEDESPWPPFFLEPQNPTQYPLQFEQAGFESLSRYYSAINTQLQQQDQRIQKALQRISSQGISIRTLNPDDYENELKKIFSLSVKAFENNFMYTPITEQEFILMYKKVQPLVQQDLVLMACNDKNELLAYLFAIPDMSAKSRGQAVDTIIIKTVAVAPGGQSRGLGSVLVGEVQRRAALAGYGKAIHALMHVDNISGNISQRYASPMRYYTLYKKAVNIG